MDVPVINADSPQDADAAPVPPKEVTPTISIAEASEKPKDREDSAIEISPNVTVWNNRYKIIKKLGAGQHSTVWLATDTKADSPDVVRAVKVLTTETTALQGTLAHELEVLQIIRDAVSRVPQDDPGASRMLQLLDHFTIPSPHGTHLALVTRVLGHSLEVLQGRFKYHMIHPNLVRDVIRQLLHALAFLHDECKVVHTDIKQDNLMMDDYGGDEKPAGGTPFVLIDLGTAEPEYGGHKRLIQPDAFQCPEAVAGLEWGTAADIWNVGCLVYELLTGEDLFEVQKPREDGLLVLNRDRIFFGHLLDVVRNPEDSDEKLHTFFSRSVIGRTFFTSDGKLIPEIVGDKRSLKEILLESGIDSPELVDFLQSMLRLFPEDRLPARELVKHAWLDIEDPVEYRKDSNNEEHPDAAQEVGRGFETMTV
ncbi:kinase-like protein [Peniophora sp. CONT]|nr:kinase-like protein [Peniophora sp. CONT]